MLLLVFFFFLFLLLVSFFFLESCSPWLCLLSSILKPTWLWVYILDTLFCLAVKFNSWWRSRYWVRSRWLVLCEYIEIERGFLFYFSLVYLKATLLLELMYCHYYCRWKRNAPGGMEKWQGSFLSFMLINLDFCGMLIMRLPRWIPTSRHALQVPSPSPLFLCRIPHFLQRASTISLLVL